MCSAGQSVVLVPKRTVGEHQIVAEIREAVRPSRRLSNVEVHLVRRSRPSSSLRAAAGASF